jgi:hypothetical protein
LLCDFQKAKLAEAESFSHLGMQKSPAGTVRLYPFAIDHKLGDGPLAHVAKHFVRRAWSRLNVDLSDRRSGGVRESASLPGNRGTTGAE